MSSITSQTILLPAVEKAIDEFKLLIDPAFRTQIRLTPLYLVRPNRAGIVHWPAYWEDVWECKVQAGLYLHFNEEDALLYVGKAVSVQSRLTAYYAYADRYRDRSCRVVHAELDAAGGCGVRAIALDGNLRFHTPALEWFLIHELNPPLNSQGRNWQPVDT